MLRHLKNFNELVLYASISCGLAFFTRLNPSFFWAILMLRLCVLVYAGYIISYLEDNRIFGWCLGASVLVGLVGGNFDWLQLQFTFNQQAIINTIILIFALPILAFGFYFHYQGGRNAVKGER